MKKFLLLSLGLALVFMLGSANSYALTMYIGDVDGFGYGGAPGYNGAYGGPADRNNNGILDSGDTLPDLNQNGILATGQGDDFDNRSDMEKSDPSGSGAQWTDVSLSTSFAECPGLANDVSFTFNFTIDDTDPYYGQDHFISFVYGDYDVKPMYADVEGDTVELLGNQNAGYDGYIWRAYAPVAWADMVDGTVTIDIIALYEPYVAFDYALLDAEPLSVVPEPATLLLLGSGLAGIAALRRRKRK